MTRSNSSLPRPPRPLTRHSSWQPTLCFFLGTACGGGALDADRSGNLPDCSIALLFCYPCTPRKKSSTFANLRGGTFALTAMGLGFARPEPSPCLSLPQPERPACIEDQNQEAAFLEDCSCSL
jgi:hypothetical protein